MPSRGAEKEEEAKEGESPKVAARPASPRRHWEVRPRFLFRCFLSLCSRSRSLIATTSWAVISGAGPTRAALKAKAVAGSCRAALYRCR